MALSRRAFLRSGATLAGTALSARPALAAYGDTPVGGIVTVAVVAPFTGDDIRAGEQIGNGVRAALDDANQLRGNLDRAYTMRTFDDQNLLASGLVNAEFACDDATVVAVIGHLSGRITEACLPTYVNNRMPVICPTSTYDRLTAHGYGNIVRLTVKDSTEGRAAARHVGKSAPTSVVVLSQDGDYGPDVAGGFLEQAAGDKLKTNALSFSWNKPDFAAVTQSTLAFKPDAVFLAGTTKDMGPVVPQLRAAGYTGAFFASQGFFDPLTLAKYASPLEGLSISTSMPPLAIAPGAFRIRNDYERRYGTLTPLAAYAYAAAQIVVAVVRRTGSQDRLSVARALNASSTFETVVGPLTFGNDGDPQDPNVYFYRVVNGAWKYETSSLPSSFVVH